MPPCDMDSALHSCKHVMYVSGWPSRAGAPQIFLLVCKKLYFDEIVFYISHFIYLSIHVVSIGEMQFKIEIP